MGRKSGPRVAELRGSVLSGSPHLSSSLGKAVVWSEPVSFLPQRLYSLYPAPPHLWRGLYNVFLHMKTLSRIGRVAYRHPRLGRSAPQFPHPQKGYDNSAYFIALL